MQDIPCIVVTKRGSIKVDLWHKILPANKKILIRFTAACRTQVNVENLAEVEKCEAIDYLTMLCYSKKIRSNSA
jgi:hypothetical protein